jgi:hypothetical protein
LSRLSLPEVALCAVTSVAIDETIRALERSLDQVEFGSALLLSDRPVEHPRISWRRIERIRTQEEYSEFVLRKLFEHVDRPNALVVQWDSFVLDKSRWDAAFLDYDYIGAPWPQFEDNRVGNGGFSLRSKRLLELTASSDFPGSHPEDLSICRTYRPLLERLGIRFAPTSVAARFSFERGERTDSFGFHGLFNFPTVLSGPELEVFLTELDVSRIAGRDGADFILELAHRGRVRDAWRLARQRRSGESWRRDLRFLARLAKLTFAPTG